MSDYKKYGEYSKECSRSETAKTALTFFAVGAGVGALVSLLFAPRSGSEIRQTIVGKLDDARRGLINQTSRVRRSTRIAGRAHEKIMPISGTQ